MMMIYRNNRPFPITISNPKTGEQYIVESMGLTPKLPDGLDKMGYDNVLIPLYISEKIVRGVGERDGELFEEYSGNDGLYESGDNDSELIPLNEAKRGRGRPKKQ